LLSWALTASGMVLQCSGWWRSSGDGRTGPMATEETRLTGLTSRRRPVRARDRHPYHFRGFCHPLSRVRCTGRTRVGGIVSRCYRTVSYSGRDGLTGRVGETASGYDSQAVSVGRCGGDSPLTGRPRCVRAFNAPVGEVGVGAADPREPRARRNLARGGVQPSSEAESRPRGRPALERGGVSPEGASSPRARRSLAQGGIHASSEAVFCPRGASSHRARRSFGGTALCPSSEAEFRLRGAGADHLMGRPGVSGSWAPVTRS
jgi:hypothetical protein